MPRADEPDPGYWSAAEARQVLAPHLSVADVRRIIRAARLSPAGHRHSSSFRGRRAAVYPAEELITLLAPFT